MTLQNYSLSKTLAHGLVQNIMKHKLKKLKYAHNMHTITNCQLFSQITTRDSSIIFFFFFLIAITLTYGLAIKTRLFHFHSAQQITQK